MSANPFVKSFEKPSFVFSKLVMSTWAIAVPKSVTLQNTAHVQAAELLFSEAQFLIARETVFTVMRFALWFGH